MNRIQMVAYPTILARRNIAMISHLGTGKTVGYIVPLASHLSTSEYYDKVTWKKTRSGLQQLSLLLFIVSFFTVQSLH